MNLLERIAASYPRHKDSWIMDAGDPVLRPLPFYRQSVVLTIRNSESDPDSVAAYVVDQHTAFHLDGTLDAIMALNAAYQLELGRDQVPEYLRFVFGHIGEGKLRIIEDSREFRWSEAALSDALFSHLINQANTRVHPVQVSNLEDGAYAVRLTGLFKNLLVECRLSVAKDGKVAPQSQLPLLENLPTGKT